MLKTIKGSPSLEKEWGEGTNTLSFMIILSPRAASSIDYLQTFSHFKNANHTQKFYVRLHKVTNIHPAYIKEHYTFNAKLSKKALCKS